jgi:hypothetical protein
MDYSDYSQIEYLLDNTSFFHDNKDYLYTNISVLNNIIDHINTRVSSPKDFEDFKDNLIDKSKNIQEQTKESVIAIYGVITAVSIIHQTEDVDECLNLLRNERDKCYEFKKMIEIYPGIKNVLDEEEG